MPDQITLRYEENISVQPKKCAGYARGSLVRFSKVDSRPQQLIFLTKVYITALKKFCAADAADLLALRRLALGGGREYY